VRNTLLTILIPIFLAACGSGSESNIDHEQLVRFKGLEQPPELTLLSSAESGGYIDLNQSISGEITGSEKASFNYIPSYSGYVSFQFDSPSENVWLNIEEDGVGIYTLWFSRGEASVFYLSAGKVYTFEFYQYFVAEDGFTLIEKPDVIGEFELSLADLSRQSLQLSENEFLLALNHNGSVHEQGRPENAGYYPEQFGAENYRRLLIMNFLDGYKRDLYLESEVEYAQVSGTAFEFHTPAEIKQYSEGGIPVVIPESHQELNLDVGGGLISGLYYYEYDIGLEQEMFGISLRGNYVCTYYESNSVMPPAESECAMAKILNSSDANSLYSTLRTDWRRISDGTLMGKIIL